jgi:hypothetical protein
MRNPGRFHAHMQIEQQIQIDVELLSISRTELEEAAALLQLAAKDILLSQELSAGNWISSDFKKIADRVQEKLQNYYVKQQSAIQLRMGGSYSRFALEQSLQKVFEQWNLQTEKEISAEFELITTRFYKKAKTIAAPISKLIGELLQRELQLEFEPEDMTFEIDYWVSIKDELLEWLLPTLPIFMRQFVIKLQIKSELKYHSCNLHSYIKELLEKKVQQFVHSFKVQVEQFVSQIYDSLTKALKNQELVAKRLAELKEAVSVDLLLIERMRTELDKLK